MQLITVLLLTSSLATMVMGATDIMECHKPALLSNCKKVCDCPGDAWNGNVRPDCSLPICHDNCLCHGKFYRLQFSVKPTKSPQQPILRHGTRAPLHLLHIPERARSRAIAAPRNPSLSQSQRHTRTGSNTKELERGSELVEHKKRFWHFKKWRLGIWGFVLVFFASKKVELRKRTDKMDSVQVSSRSIKFQALCFQKESSEVQTMAPMAFAIKVLPS